LPPKKDACLDHSAPPLSGLRVDPPIGQSYDVTSQMTSESQATQQDETDGPVSDTRRALIRKAAYSAPVLIALGSLSRIQIAAAAQIGISGPPCQPGHICRQRAPRR